MSTVRLSEIKNAYWLPTTNEWWKAAYYDPTLNSGSGGYWNYATRSNTAPTAVTANSTGDGSAGNTGNFANWNKTANWNGSTNGNITTVGTNGGPSYYGTFDQGGSVSEWINNNDGVTAQSAGGTFVWGFAIDRGTYSQSTLTSEDSTTGFRIATIYNILNLSNLVSIENINNNNDNYNRGSVSYIYQIGKYEVTNNEYVEFLNAIAKTDTYNTYNVSMNNTIFGGISRSGTSGNYTYSVKTNMGNKPITYVNWYDCARYCNWLTNGKPSGMQDTTTTEYGIYPLYDVSSGAITKSTSSFKIIRNSSNQYKVKG